MNNRLERLRAKLVENNFDAFFVSSPENRRYLSGFSGSAGFLIISKDAAVLATDFRYVEQAGQQSRLPAPGPLGTLHLRVVR